MIEIERSKLIKYYIAANIVGLLNYNLFSEQLPITAIIPIQLLLSLNFIAVGLYALFKDNIVLNSSDNFEKTTVIGIVTQYAPVCELFKLIFSSEERARAYTTPVYLLSILFHSLLNDKYPQFFDKFKKFNFGFSIQYLILIAFNVQFNKLIPCVILGAVATYYSSLTLDYMTIITSNVIYSTVFVEGLLPLIIILSPSKDGATVLIGFLIGGIATCAIYLVAVISQFRKVNNAPENGYTQVEGGDNIEDGRNTQSSDNNYSTFNN